MQALTSNNTGTMATRFQIQDRRADQPAWVDDFPDSALAQLLGTLPEANVYALIDNAFDTGFALRLRSRFPGLHPQSLYEGRYDGPGLAEIAPSVVRIPVEETERRLFLEFLLYETSGKPMLSFLHRSASALDPVAHLQDQMEAVDHAAKPFLIRFSDTRSLDALLQVFDDAQRERFLNGFRWWFFQRDGSLECVGHADDAPAERPGEPFVFSQAQMDRFDALARPDGLLRLIQTNVHWWGELTGTPSQAHGCIRAALETSGVSAGMHDAVVFRVVASALSEAGLLQSQETTEQS